MSKTHLTFLKLFYEFYQNKCPKGSAKERTFEKLQNDNIEEIVIDGDFYWTVSLESMDDFNRDPELTVGSLNDDLSFLNSLILEDYDAGYLELERLAAVFRFMSKTIRA